MNALPDKSTELIDLLGLFCGGDADEVQFARLQELVARDEHALAYYVEYIQIHGGLEWAFRHQYVAAAETMSGSAATSLQLSSATDAPSNASPRPAPIAHLGWLADALPTRLIALSVALILGGYFVVVLALIPLARWAGSTRPGEAPAKQATVGTLASEAEARWSDDRPEPRSSVLQSGKQYNLASGRVDLALNGGTQIVIDGPASWQLESNQRLHFSVGKLTAYVPPAAVGFVVQTPSVQVIDLGTEFGVEVDAKGGTDLHVLKGGVAVVRTRGAIANSNEQSTQLKGGQAIRVSADGNTTSIISLDRGRFESARLLATGPPSAAVAEEVVITNPSFEQTPADGFPGFPGYCGDIPGWIPGSAGSTGLNDSSGPFADNGAIFDGTEVAFIQSYGTGPYSLSQKLPPLAVGVQYTLSFDYNARAITGPPLLTVTLGDHKLMESVTVTPVDAAYVYAGRYHQASLTFTGIASDILGPTLTIANSQTGDTALLIDHISLKTTAKIPEPKTRKAVD